MKELDIYANIDTLDNGYTVQLQFRYGVEELNTHIFVSTANEVVREMVTFLKVAKEKMDKNS